MNKPKSLLALLVVIAAIGGLLAFAGRFGGGEKVESEQPAVVCKNENECFWTAHIHAEVHVFRGDEGVSLNFEQGKLEEEHTHTDKNKLHWHGLIPVDENKNVADWSALEVGRIPQDLGLGLPGEPRFIVNGEEVEPGYIWKDGDRIEIHYD